MSSFSRIDSALLTLLRRNFANSGEQVTLAAEDWHALFVKATAHRVLLPIMNDVTNLVPSDFQSISLSSWKVLAHDRKTKNNKIAEAEQTLLDALKKASIPALAMHGIAESLYYPTPLAREMTHVDILIDGSSLFACNTLLEQMNIHHLPSNSQCSSSSQRFIDEQGIIYIIREKIDTSTIGDEQSEVRLRSLLVRTLDHVEYAEIENYSFPVPSLSVLSLFILLNAKRSINKSQLTLTSALDWAMLLSGPFSTRDMRTTVLTWKQCGLWETAELLSLTAAMLLSLPIAEWFKNADKQRANELLSLILTVDANKLLHSEKVYRKTLLCNQKLHKEKIAEKKKANGNSTLFAKLLRKNKSK